MHPILFKIVLSLTLVLSIIALPAHSQADIVVTLKFSEIALDPSSLDEFGQWVEIYNPSNRTVQPVTLVITQTGKNFPNLLIDEHLRLKIL